LIKTVLTSTIKITQKENCCTKQTADSLTLQFLFDAFISSLKHFIIIFLLQAGNNNSPEFHKVVQ